MNGKLVEPRRTSHDKSYKDLLNCVDLPADSKICFLDDQYHESMKHKNVCYINIKPYKQFLPLGEIAERYFKYFQPNVERLKFINTPISSMSIFNLKIIPAQSSELGIDYIVGKKMLLHIKRFFDINDNNYTTVKKKGKTKKKVKKNI